MLWRKIQAVRAERLANEGASYSIWRWQKPGLFGQFRQLNLAAVCPMIVRSGNCNDSFFEKNLGVQVFVEGLGKTPEDEIDGSLAQGAMLLPHFVNERAADFDAR